MQRNARTCAGEEGGNQGGRATRTGRGCIDLGGGRESIRG